MLNANGTITGTPTSTGASNFTLQVSDNFTPPQTFSRPYLLSVFEPIAITNNPTTQGTVGTPYSFQVTASGGEPAYTFGGSGLPPGLTITPAGLISGTPTTAGSYYYGLLVSDSRAAGARLTSQSGFITIVNPPLTITTPSLVEGTVGVSYLQTLAAQNGTGPYSFSLISGALTPGLTLAANGGIQGIPTAAGSFTFTAQVQDSSRPPLTATKIFTVTTAAPVVVSTANLSGGSVGALYSRNVTASGGSGIYTFALTGTQTLPPGLGFFPTGLVSGTPTAAGSYTFQVTATDNSGLARSGTQAATIVIASSLVITTTSVPNAVAGSPYSQALVATGGITPYTWAVASGALPPGLTLSPTTGILTGTPTTPGTFTFDATVSDSSTPQQTASRSFTIAVATQLLVTTASLPAASVGLPYSQPLAATGGTAPYTWTLASGSTLPTGLSLSSSGVISGVPSAAGTVSFTVNVVDSSNPVRNAAKVLSIQVVGPVVITSPPAIGPSEAGIATLVQLTASGGVPPYTWTLVDGRLPRSISLSPNGILAGPLEETGTFAFTLRATDTLNNSATRLFTWVVRQRRVVPEILSVLPSGQVGVFYASRVSVRNGTGPYQFSISGTPPGLTAATSGEITGTPTRPGTFTVTISLTDDNGDTASGTATIIISASAIVVAGDVSEGRVGAPLGTTFQATGGIGPYTFAGSGLPRGLSLSAGGSLSGTPTEAGTFPVIITATDSTGEKGTRSVVIVIRPAQLVITTVTAVDGVVGAAYSSGFAASGGTPPYTFSASGSLPAGLTFAGSTLSGTPTEAGTFQFTVQVTDSAQQTATKAFTVTISSQLILTTTSFPGGTVGSGYAGQVSAAGGQAPYLFSATGLPPGLGISAAGAISGVPTTAGTFTVNVQVADARNSSASKSLTIAIVAPLSISTASLTDGTAGAPYSGAIVAAGGTAPYVFTLSGGSLPPGVTLGQNGTLSGTPRQAGTFTFTASVTDAGQPATTASKPFTIVIGVPNVSGLTITLPPTPGPGQQPTLTLNLGQPFPLDIQGTATITFTPDAVVNGDDPAIQFSTGGRSVNFTIPAGSTQANFPNPTIALQTGTVAGTITITTSLTTGGVPVNCSCTLTRTIQISRSAPTISSARVTRTANGFTVVIAGFSTTRELTQATFRFGGTNLQTTDTTVPLTGVVTPFFQTSTFGGAFSLTVPFTLQGDSTGVSSVTITLANSVGSSNSVPVTF